MLIFFRSRNRFNYFIWRSSSGNVYFIYSVQKQPTLFNWIGMITMIGIILLFFPFDLNSSQPINGFILMLIAAFGWGIYSINGIKSKNHLTSTMSNFIFTIPIVIINFIIFPDNISLTYFGIFLAICSGAIMSALGYSLWYTILPYLEKNSCSPCSVTSSCNSSRFEYVIFR